MRPCPALQEVPAHPCAKIRRVIARIEHEGAKPVMRRCVGSSGDFQFSGGVSMKTRSLTSRATDQTTSTRQSRSPRMTKRVPKDTPAIAYADPTVCESCGAVFTRKTWRMDHHMTQEMFEAAAWGQCPACREQRDQIGSG